MELVLIMTALFALLFIVEVFLGGTLPGAAGPRGVCGLRSRMPVREFFGQALPLALAGIGLPMSVQHPWAALLVIGAAALYLFLRPRDGKRSR